MALGVRDLAQADGWDLGVAEKLLGFESGVFWADSACFPYGVLPSADDSEALLRRVFHTDGVEVPGGEPPALAVGHAVAAVSAGYRSLS